MFGLVNVNKPAGITSRDVVNRVQRLVRPDKVGHAGTLDPLATGVLVVAIGPATRLVEYVQRMPKTYRGTFLLGRTSDTEDIEGTVHELADPPRPTADQVQTATRRLVGTIDQVPPAYSALKIGGQRAYELARRGQAVELQSRPVEIYSLDLVSYSYPELTLLVRCGSGTYVRSLGRDLARSLGSDAVMSALRREAIGPFTIDSAVDGDALTMAAFQSHMLSPLLAVSQLPRIDVSGDEARRLAMGQAIDNRWDKTEEEIAAVGPRQELIAIVVPVEAGKLRANKSFAGAGGNS
ncbi:MAG: tRNA pseudouridine(55) synthase TruB [Planctomycetaceae bacterium]|nr:tRNA pseudouridine(55) synthase TruB [Planctomycetaceae bacterium]